MRPSAANPPTTPPAIAPALDLLAALAEPFPEVAVLLNPGAVEIPVPVENPVTLVLEAEDAGAAGDDV